MAIYECIGIQAGSQIRLDHTFCIAQRALAEYIIFNR